MVYSAKVPDEGTDPTRLRKRMTKKRDDEVKRMRRMRRMRRKEGMMTIEWKEVK